MSGYKQMERNSSQTDSDEEDFGFAAASRPQGNLLKQCWGLESTGYYTLSLEGMEMGSHSQGNGVRVRLDEKLEIFGFGMMMTCSWDRMSYDPRSSTGNDDADDDPSDDLVEDDVKKATDDDGLEESSNGVDSDAGGSPVAVFASRLQTGQNVLHVVSQESTHKE
ncbi:hypothetical protein Dimus_025440 [Dionaea muscipula]